MARVAFSELGETNLQRVLGHSPSVLEAFLSFKNMLGTQTSLPEPLREEVRRHLAWRRGCQH